MKNSPPSLETMETFFRLKFTFLIPLVLAVIIWQLQDFAASFAATEVTTSTRLRTTEERDDARVSRAFQEARGKEGVKVTFETEPNPQQQTRDARLTIVANSKKEALEARETLVNSMKTVFAAEGPGELFDIGNTPSVKPVPDHAYFLVKQIFQGFAAMIALVALAMLAMKWKSSGLPRGALLGILASGLTTLLIMLQREAAPVWTVLLVVGPPTAFLILVGVLMARVHRAATWVEGRARITRSRAVSQRHRFQGDTTKVRNLAEVEYEFDSGSGKIQGDRISLGAQPADQVDVVLKRYPVGANVPVYYDPHNPQDCVLERNPPASPGCIWGGAIFGVLIYALIVFVFWNGVSVNTLVNRTFPHAHHPLLVGVTGFLGLFCLAAGIWNMLHPRKAFPWTKTKGTIVSSVTESFQEGGNSGERMRTYYRPVIEYRYEVEGQEYHGATSSAAITVAGGQASADAEVARFPVGKEVDVYFNPQNPTQSGLDVDTEMMLDGRRSLIVGIVFVAVAIYAAMH